MGNEQQDEGAEFPSATDTRSREEQKNQPHYLGDKVDDAVHRMEEEGTPMSDHAEELLAEAERKIHEVADEPASDA